MSISSRRSARDLAGAIGPPATREGRMSFWSGWSMTMAVERRRERRPRDEAKSERRGTLEPPTTSPPPTFKCSGGVQGGDTDSVTLYGVISSDIESLTCLTHVIRVPHVSGSLSRDMSSLCNVTESEYPRWRGVGPGKLKRCQRGGEVWVRQGRPINR